MGERKGQNKYYPPDYDPKVGGLNKFLGTHALRERANKIHLGILIIRFEMPYNIWCEGCKNHIGMGVRYNAEKTKIGMYYSTPVYQFRMKCHLCENYIEIKTDPGNLDYVIVSGARRQENRWDPNDNEQIVSDTKEFQRKLFDDPMFKLEHLANDQKKGNDVKPILGRLYERNDDVWRDNYVANCKLRASFRSQKKELKRLEDIDNDLKIRSSLDINLLPETEQDRKMANLMKLQTARTLAENEHEQILNLMNKPALPSSTITSFGGLRREKLLKTKLNKSDLGIVLSNAPSTSSTSSSSSSSSSASSSSSSASSLVINGEHKKRKLDEIDSNNKKLCKEDTTINNTQTVPESDGDINNNNNNSVKKLINSNNSNEINSEKIISLVCNYNSSSDNDSHSDNEIINDNNNRT